MNLRTTYERVAGLDVHKEVIVACIRTPLTDGSWPVEKRNFGTMTVDLLAFSDWLSSHEISHVAMESTGAYWKPVFNILENNFEVIIVNVQHISKVPGRKTDQSDAEWIAELMQHGLLKASFIPPLGQRELHELTRYCTRLLDEKAAAFNRLHKVLEDANIKITSVLTDVQGALARLMLDAIIQWRTDAEQLAELAKGRLRNKIPDLVEALCGQVRSYHRFMFQETLNHIDELNAHITSLNERIQELVAPDEVLITRLTAIPGVGRRTAEILLAEIGHVVEHFPSAKHLASWACLSWQQYQHQQASLWQNSQGPEVA